MNLTGNDLIQIDGKILKSDNNLDIIIFNPHNHVNFITAIYEILVLKNSNDDYFIKNNIMNNNQYEVSIEEETKNTIKYRIEKYME